MKDTVRFAQWVFDLSELDEEIDKYISNNGKQPYLFMNSDSAESFDEDFDKEEFPYINVYQDYYDSYGCLAKTYVAIMEYRGCKVYINKELDYGEIEIR